MRNQVTFLFFLFFVGVSFGQEPDQENSGTVMRRSVTGGLNFNANAGATGWGVGFEYALQKTYKYKRTVGFTFTNIRHPKEFKIYSLFSNSRGYFFGKLNSFISLRPTYGGKRILFQSKRENGIEIAFKWNVGPSIGFLKPVYLSIEKLAGAAVDEKYNPTVHNFENISARANWVNGVSEGKFKLGAFTKIGVDFNFSTVKHKISGGEVGFMIDYFPGAKIPILYNNDGNNLFSSLYLQFNIGQKLY